METLSVVVLTKDSERMLERALESVKWADEIIIVDGYSKDNTLKICKKHGAKVYQRKLKGWDEEWNFGFNKCKKDWTMILGSDEVLPKALQTEIRQFLKNPKDVNGMIIERKEYFMNRYIMITKKQVRIFRKGVAHYEGATHEILKIEGKIKKFKNKMEHYSYIDLNYQLDKINKITNFELKKLEDAGKDYGRWMLRWKMFFEPRKSFGGLLLYKRLIFRGMPGLTYALYSRMYAYVIYSKYYEKKYMKSNK